MKSASKPHIMHPEKIPLHCLQHQGVNDCSMPWVTCCPKRGHHCGLGLAHCEFKHSIHFTALLETTFKLLIMHPEKYLKIFLHHAWHHSSFLYCITNGYDCTGYSNPF